MALLVRRGEVAGAGTTDLRLDAGRVVEIGPGLARRRGEELVDADGGAVIPGLHDHHVHLRAQAAAAVSVLAGPPECTTAEQLASRLAEADARLAEGEWLRAVAYHESVAGDLDRFALDRLVSSRPVRLQHRSASVWVLNSAGVEALGVEWSGPEGVERDGFGRATGRLVREDSWLAGTLAKRPPLDLAEPSAAAAARGVTGLTDATVDQSPADLAALADDASNGVILQRLCLMAPPGARLVRTVRPSCYDGAAAPPVTLGPVKLVLDDCRLPGLDELVATIGCAHRRGRAVAVHCVTRVQAALLIAALERAGARPGDRMEHASVLGTDMIGPLASLGVTVVTQPGFVHARGDRYRSDVDPSDRGDLWRLASLLDAGVAMGGGTDAPFGPADPWLAVRAAVTRTTSGGNVLGLGERVDALTALGLFLGRPEAPSVPRKVAPGQPADLCVLSEPLPTALRRVVGGEGDPGVLATIVAGRTVHRAGAGHRLRW